MKYILLIARLRSSLLTLNYVAFYLGCSYQRIRNDVALNSQMSGIRGRHIHNYKKKITIWSREVNTHSASPVIPRLLGADEERTAKSTDGNTTLK